MHTNASPTRPTGRPATLAPAPNLENAKNEKPHQSKNQSPNTPSLANTTHHYLQRKTQKPINESHQHTNTHSTGNQPTKNKNQEPCTINE
jgi:hypothetical protein